MDKELSHTHPGTISVWVRRPRLSRQPRYLCDWPISQLGELLEHLSGHEMQDVPLGETYVQFLRGAFVIGTGNAGVRYEIEAR